jgi:hypothetical protein
MDARVAAGGTHGARSRSHHVNKCAQMRTLVCLMGARTRERAHVLLYVCFSLVAPLVLGSTNCVGVLCTNILVAQTWFNRI